MSVTSDTSVKTELKSIVDWDNTTNILEKGTDFLKNNLATMDRYLNIWKATDQTGKNSKEAINAARDFRRVAAMLKDENKKFLGCVEPRLLASCGFNANSSETERLTKIISTARIANEYFKSVIGNTKLPGSFSELRTFGSLGMLFAIPSALVYELVNYERAYYPYVDISSLPGIANTLGNVLKHPNGKVILAVTLLGSALVGLSRSKDDFNEKKMYAMRNLFEKALTPASA